MGYKQWHLNEFNAVNGTTTAKFANTSLKAAPGAGVSVYVTDVIFSNEGTANQVMLLNGSGGTALVNIYMAANTNFTHRFEVPIKLTANTALCITSTADDHLLAMVNGFTSRG
jgi:hypothetical protein